VENGRAVRELKFVVESSRVPMILSRLQSICAPDARYSEGVVSSIYFDTWDWRSLYEKINSDYIKTKIRLRWYRDVSGTGEVTKAYWEIKGKVGARREKARYRTEYGGQWLARMGLNNPRLMVLPQKLRREGMQDRGFLLPVLLIRYARRRFVDRVTGMRIAVDYDINVPAMNPLLFGVSLPFALRRAVIEFKGPAGVLPDCMRHLRDMGCRRESFSKYGTCCGRAMERAL